MSAGNIGKLNCQYPIFCCNMGQLKYSIHWFGIVCNIFWKSFNVARSMGKLKAEFSELLLNCPYSTFHSWNFAIWGNSNMHFWEVSILNCPYPTFHCFVRNSWNFSIWGCIVGRYAELSLTNMIWEFIKRSSFIIGVD